MMKNASEIEQSSSEPEGNHKNQQSCHHIDSMDRFPNVHILDHPLIKDKVARLRNVDTDFRAFRELVSEISALMTYEAFRDIPTETVRVRTPFEEIDQSVVKEGSVTLIPILRAGLGMVEGVQSMLPQANVGHIGLARNEETLEPEEYYCKLPPRIADGLVVILDPMLATGGSASAAITKLKERGCRNIRALFILAAPEGIQKVAGDHPDTEIYIAVQDRCLNDRGYILPGLGDAGDRIFGTL